MYTSFSGGSVSKESGYSVGRPGFDPWVGKIPWRRKWQPTPYSFLGNPMDRGAWQVWKKDRRWTETVEKLEPLDSWCWTRILPKARCSKCREPGFPCSHGSPLRQWGACVLPAPHSSVIPPQVTGRGGLSQNTPRDRWQMAPGETQKGSAGKPSTGGRPPAAKKEETLVAC